MNKIKLGNVIQELRLKRKKWTQKELAKATGFKHLSISQIETGFRGASNISVMFLAEALDVPFSYIYLLSETTDDPEVKRLQGIVRTTLGLD